MTNYKKAVKANAIVTEIGDWDWGSERGIWIPIGWFSAPELKHLNGKPNLNAIILLADIIYWHRPIVIRHPVTNEIQELRRKFHPEKLQKNYGSWGAGFGLTKRQAQEACYFLKERGLINIGGFK